MENPALTDEQTAELLARYEAGETSRTLAPAYGVSQSWIVQLLRRRGIMPLKQRRLSGAQVDEARRLYADHLPASEIARRLGVSGTEVERALVGHKHRRSAHHPDAFVDEVVRVYASGVPLAEVAARYEIHPSTVSKWLRRSGLVRPEPVPHKRGGRRPDPTLPDDVVALIIASYKAGVPVSQIAELLGITRYRVRKALE